MRVVVFGSSGLLGSSLVPSLRARGHEVLTGREEPGPRVDLSDRLQTTRVLEVTAPAVIVNLAGLTSVEECERNPRQAYTSNVRIVENLVRWVLDHRKACRLVQLSTDQVYDGAGPHQEDDPSPTNYYGFSKYAGDLVAAAASATVLRTNFFGPSQCHGRSSLTDWLAHSLTHQRKITVFDDVRFSPLALHTLVGLINLAIERDRPGIFNLGSKNGMSKADFAFAFAKALDFRPDQMRRGPSNTVVYRPKDMSMDSSRFERAFDVDLPALESEIQSMQQAYEAR